MQYTGSSAGPRNIVSIIWALPLACAAAVLTFFGCKMTYFAIVKSGGLGVKTAPSMGIAAYDGLIWYFQLPIAILILLVCFGIFVSCWKAVFE